MSRVGLQVGIFAFLIACSASQPERARAPGSERWGGLSVEERGRGETVVVLMHGYGAPGDDLVGLGEELARSVPARFVMPAAPRVWMGGPPGRAWFERDPALVGEQLPSASRAVEGVLSTLADQGVARDRVVLAGFSQGAMMALERALRGPEPPRAVVMLSGGLPRGMSESELDFARLSGVPVFVSHGREDALLPFSRAEQLAARAEEAGARVTFVPFDGGHSIPAIVRAELAAFLRDVAAREPSAR